MTGREATAVLRCPCGRTIRELSPSKARMVRENYDPNPERCSGCGSPPASRSGDDVTEQQRAMKWALVKFVCALDIRKAEDEELACEANGWRSRSAHDLYDDVIDTVSRLATGSLDAEAYMEEERRKMLDGVE